MWGALSDERTGLSFTIASGARQRSHSRVRVPWDSRPCFTVSDSRLPFSSPPTTRRVTMEVFDPASTRETVLRMTCPPFNNFGRTEWRPPPRTISCHSVRCHGNVLTEPLASNGLIHSYSLQRKHDYRTVPQQWTSALGPLFRLSGVMSQYNCYSGRAQQ
jgi:hypothetical protein